MTRQFKFAWNRKSQLVDKFKFTIQKFVDEDNRDTNYDDMFDGDIFKELHDELKKTSYIKQLLLGDISPEKYRKLFDQI